MGVEVFSLQGATNSFPVTFFTHPTINNTVLNFANTTLSLKKGILNWLISFKPGWPFSQRVSYFALVMALVSASVTWIESISQKLCAECSTYILHS